MASGNDTPDPNKPKRLAAALKKTNGKKPPKAAEPVKKPKKK